MELLLLLLLHPNRRFHRTDKVRASEKFYTALPAVFDVPKGVDVPVLVNAMQKIRGSTLVPPIRTECYL